MDELPAPPPLAQAAPLLLLLAFIVMLLAAHVASGYTRWTLRDPRPVMRWLFRAAAAVALGSGLWASMVLAISAEAQSYALGFSGLQLAAAIKETSPDTRVVMITAARRAPRRPAR